MQRLLLCLFLAGCASSDRLQVAIDTEEADAVLAILAKRGRSASISDADWQRLFTSRGFIRLKEREKAMGRPFDEAMMRELVMSGDLAAREAILSRTIAIWRGIDISHPASKALRYLPPGTTLRATVFPVIKPRDNSFVFDTAGDPAIFMFVREEPRARLENTLAHELHHIGLAAACRSVAFDDLSKPQQQAIMWIGAFGEGIAMLAAAGGPDVHPHAASEPTERERWDRDVTRVAEDLRLVEAFLLDVAGGRLDDETTRNRAMEFFGVQGPWYTVGWMMASTIDKELGRKALIDAMCDGPKLLATYNRAAAGKSLPLWSDELLALLRA